MAEIQRLAATEFTGTTTSAYAPIILERSQRKEFRAYGAILDDNMIGFAYGAPCRVEDRWYQLVEPPLEAKGNEHWLEQAFTLSELHVHPAHQGRGIGSTLIKEICRNTNFHHCLLGVAEANTRARCVYESLGYSLLCDPIRTRVGSTPFMVMGIRLPM
ncbi:GNAT family N-acetyltransferase [Streptomyces sp. 1222.5]|uniref:GNAT family N-acetyltransferase n=1 Tax=Streptomyces sp. 1222.5 TaxID=1881026 RepID=UPI003D73A34D